MKTKAIKKLAEMSLIEGSINQKVMLDIATRLKKSELRVFLFYLKMFINSNTVTIKLPDGPDYETEKTFSRIFGNMNIKYDRDTGIGAGLQVEYGDNLISLNIRNLIARAIVRMKENI